MLTSRRVVLMFSSAVALLGTGGACGQTTSTGSGQGYPYKALRIVTSGVGGGSDFVARQIAQGISAPLGQPVIVENRGGGGIGTGEIVAQASPDGYTLIVGSNSLWIAPLLEKLPYDVVKDFAPITTTTEAPLVLAVHPSVAAINVKELVALAKAKPGTLNYGSGNTGASNHLAGEMFKALAGINIVRIPYKGGGAVLNDVVAGQVQMTFLAGSVLGPQIKAGKLRGLAVTSTQPSKLAPGLPTMAAAGVPGYEIVGIDGILAPAKTPGPVIKRLNQEMRRFLETPEAKERFFSTGVEAVGSTPDEFASKIKSDVARMGKLIKDAGIGKQ